MTDTLPGPCYPDWPSMSKAFVVHRLDAATGTCRYCKLDWPLDSTPPTSRDADTPPNADLGPVSSA